MLIKWWDSSESFVAAAVHGTLSCRINSASTGKAGESSLWGVQLPHAPHSGKIIKEPLMKDTVTRRAFLGAGALVAAAAALPQRLDARPQPRNFSEPNGLRLAVATICMDGFGDMNFEPAFAMIPKLGFKFVEFNAWHARNLTPAGIESIKARCAQRDLIPVCVQGNAFGDGKAPDVSHKLWCMEAARRLGARRVKFTGSRRGSNGGLPSIIGTLKEIAPAAEEMGLLVLVENHAGNVLENIADYQEIFAAIDSPNVGLCLDTAHFVGAGIDPLEVVKRFHARTLHVDLKDNRTQGGGHDAVPYGTGVIQFEPLLNELLDSGYSGYLLVELAHSTPKEPVFENLKRGRDLFRKYES
jgi:sugar phosphate isomerase/epimerase